MGESKGSRSVWLAKWFFGGQGQKPTHFKKTKAAMPNTIRFLKPSRFLALVPQASQESALVRSWHPSPASGGLRGRLRTVAPGSPRPYVLGGSSAVEASLSTSHSGFQYMVLGPTGNRRCWGSSRPQNSFQKVGREAPHLVEGVFPAAGSTQTPTIFDFRVFQQ